MGLTHFTYSRSGHVIASRHQRTLLDKRASGKCLNMVRDLTQRSQPQDCFDHVQHAGHDFLMFCQCSRHTSFVRMDAPKSCKRTTEAPLFELCFCLFFIEYTIPPSLAISLFWLFFRHSPYSLLKMGRLRYRDSIAHLRALYKMGPTSKKHISTGRSHHIPQARQTYEEEPTTFYPNSSNHHHHHHHHSTQHPSIYERPHYSHRRTRHGISPSSSTFLSLLAQITHKHLRSTTKHHHPPTRAQTHDCI